MIAPQCGDSLYSILSADADIEVAGRGEDGLDAVAKAKELHPDGCADAVHGRGGG